MYRKRFGGTLGISRDIALLVWTLVYYSALLLKASDKASIS
jgi:hypothetical protein